VSGLSFTGNLGWHARERTTWQGADRIRHNSAALEVSHDSISRLWRRFCLQPHCTEGFKFSTDPQLDAKVRDVVGMYLNPPRNAVVVCVDEKSQCQALERRQPILPMRPGIPERQTHDYARHGVTCLFAAVNVATGQVTDACYPRHRHQEFLRFLKKVAAACPGADLHVICDNYSAHKHPEVKAWLAANPRVTLHFTPTGRSWLNLAECFFSIITRQAIRRGSFTSVRELVAAISAYIDNWNDHPVPFAWTKDADEILASINRAKTKASGLTGH
jgi:transposase